MYVFLTACRNEERILGAFLDEYSATIRAAGIADCSVLYVVDDLSVDRSREILEQRRVADPALALRVIETPTNFGNQGAMYYGLLRVEVGPEDVLITFDCDGEDDLREVPSIIELGRRTPDAMVFVERGRRTESLVFKTFFETYKLILRAVASATVIPNNFLLVPGKYVPAIRRSPLAAVHFAYAILKLRTPFVAVTRDRRARLGGKTSQNLFTLVSHGMVGLMVFYEHVIGKLFMLLTALWGAAVLAMGLALALPLEDARLQRGLLFATVGAGIGVIGLFAFLTSAALALVFKMAVFTLGQQQLPPVASRPAARPADRVPEVSPAGAEPGHSS
jgi:glycosyltransferase involved in cell wall biosynthesis